MWPPNEGFKVIYETLLVVGTLVDRYGSQHGSYVAAYGTPLYQRALPEGAHKWPYEVYRVVRPIHVKAGHTMPWFQTVGCGMQYKFQASIRELLERGDLERV
jgi:filamentous hemagglutinin